MSLSSDLISQFVKATKDDRKTDGETTVYGTIEISNDSTYIVLDGDKEKQNPIPLSNNQLAVTVVNGDRVRATIKNHNLVVTGNIKNPSATTEDVRSTIQLFDAIVATKASVDELYAERARIDVLVTEDISIKNRLSANEADIVRIDADNVTINDTLTANSADISKLKTDKLDAGTAKLTYATISELDAAEADIFNLESAYGDFQVLVTDRLDAFAADITELQTTKLSATEADIKYANIDFSNIGKAAIEHFYATSGLIEDVVVGDGTITGRLVGVTISGDLIEGNTVKAEKLVIKGSDGLYYKLNTDGMKTEAQQTDENSINGSVIKAKSITATKISVSDLVAFGATIGGINIASGALYSGAKASVDNTAIGIYLDKHGQMNVGDADSYIKYYIDASGNRQLEISASNITLGVDKNNIETLLDDAASTANDAQQRVTAAEKLLDLLSESISMLVTDGNGTSLMTQTENGWTFSTGDIQEQVNRTSEYLNNLTNEVGDVSGVVDILQQAVNDLGVIAEYVKIGTFEGEPSIELGESDSDFKLRITNTRMIFTEGSVVLAYFNNQSLHIKKAVVEEELQQGGFVWKARSNGNLGLVWKGGAS